VRGLTLPRVQHSLNYIQHLLNLIQQVLNQIQHLPSPYACGAAELREADGVADCSFRLIAQRGTKSDTQQ
jgi:hypothetical protein